MHSAASVSPCLFAPGVMSLLTSGVAAELVSGGGGAGDQKRHGWKAMSEMSTVAPQEQVDEWLRSLGLQYDPFRALNAGEDNHLHEYLINAKAFQEIYNDSVSFSFAPAGGGKSALRVRLARACRVGENGRRLFPIVYVLPQDVVARHGEPLRQAHVRAILRAAAFELLLRLAYRPHEFLTLDAAGQRLIHSLLEADLPMPLPHLLAQLETPADLRETARLYDPTANWPNAPDSDTLREFGDALCETLTLQAPTSPMQRLATWLEALFQVLKFEAVYLLLDGVDGYPETLTSPTEALAVLAPLLQSAVEWSREKLFLKAFLPADLQSPIRASYPHLTSLAYFDKIDWKPEDTRELLNRRMEAAWGMAPASVNMLGTPELDRLDQDLTDAGLTSPRDVLAAVEQILFAHVGRTGPTGKLTPNDVAIGLKQYRVNSRRAAST